jgi:FixJ family two-component response regulator
VNGIIPIVFIVDDDRGVRTALSCLLTAAGYQVRSFESAERFIEEQDAEAPGCLLLEVCLPGLSGLELQRALAGSPNARPIVFMTGTGDIQAGVRAMKAGAIDFLTKPIDESRLIAAVEQAFRCDAEQRQERAIRSMIQQRLETLTPRERQVMMHVVLGQFNRQIAAEIGTGEKTVKVHRGRVMSKMGAGSVAELVKLAARIGMTIEPNLSVDGPAMNWKRGLKSA